MCEFCHKHGEGKKWYLQAKNYGEDLLSDLQRRKFIEDFFSKPEETGNSILRLEKLEKLPGLIRRALSRRISNKMKKVHYGQVVPFEDISRIFEFVTSIGRVACICRHVTVGTEQRYCYGLSLAPLGGQMVEIIRSIDAKYLTGPDTKGIEFLDKDTALLALRDHEKQGLCHTIWTFQAPYIGGICNCDQSDCLAMRTTITYKVPLLFRAEYIAQVDHDFCNGCRQCLKACQFGAMGYSVALNKVVIEPRRCYGCGICRSVCTKDAISLLDRQTTPVAATIW